LHGHPARLQLAVAAPLGDRVCGLGDGRGVEADLRVLGNGSSMLESSQMIMVWPSAVCSK
jgi:hypothetical protein